MATGDEVVVLNNKQSLGLIELRERLLEIVDKWDNDVVAALWDEDGWFGGAIFGGAPSVIGTAIGEFSLSSGSERGTDGLGNLITPGVSGYSYTNNIKFENATGIDYYIALKEQRVPFVIKTSVETGLPQYVADREIVGDRSFPDAGTIVDNGSTITMEVDGITEAGVSNAGREVLVYLVTPESSVESVAIEQATVAWNGTNNEITTAGHLGQSVVSTSAADYVVVLLGPMVSRNTDLSLGTGRLFVGTVQGDAAAPPSIWDNSGSTVFVPLPDFWDVVEYGPNGGLKIAVTTDPADDFSNVPQISVKNHFANIKVFKVNEFGEIEIHDPATNVLKFKVNSSGDIVESGGDFKSTTDPIAFDDVNTIGAIPFSQAGQTQLPLALQAQTILGIAEGANTKNLISKTVIEGCKVTALGLLDVDIEAGQAIYEGFKHEIANQTFAIPAAPLTTYVYYNESTGNIAYNTAYLGDSTAVGIYLAKVVTDGVSVQTITDIRRKASRLDRRIDLMVGDMNGTASEDLIPHFETLEEAFDAISVWVLDAANPMVGPYRIQVVGDCSETTTPLQVPVDGLEIWSSAARRTGPPVGPKVSWSGNTALFDINGKTGLVFSGLEMRFNGTATTGAVAPSEVCFANSGAAPFELVIKDCIATNADGFLYYVAADSWGDVLIDNCRGFTMQTCGIIIHDTSDLSAKIRINQCWFDKGGTGKSLYNEGINVRGFAEVKVLDCQADDFDSHAYEFQNCGVSIRGNEAGSVGDGILIQAGCAGDVSKNKATTVGGDGIASISEGIRILGNTILDPGGYGVNIGPNGDRCDVGGNHIAGAGDDGVNVAADDVTVGKNHIVTSANDAIDATGTCTIIEGNHTDGDDITATGFGVVVNGNHTKGGDINLAGASGGQYAAVVGNNLLLDSTPTGGKVQNADIDDDVAHNVEGP